MLNFTGSLAEISIILSWLIYKALPRVDVIGGGDNFPLILPLSISCCWHQGDLLQEANDHLRQQMRSRPWLQIPDGEPPSHLDLLLTSKDDHIPKKML
jgi:hypothetical protein